MSILKPERTRLVKYLRKKKRVIFSELMADMNRTPVSLNNDLKILSRYKLVNIFKVPNPGHGVHRVIEPTFGNHKIEFKTEI
jgi:predicted transcriptional regulator